MTEGLGTENQVQDATPADDGGRVAQDTQTPDVGLEQQAGQETQPNYGGFQTPEELVEAYEKTARERDDLVNIKGRHGTKIEQLNREVATLRGAYNTLQEVMRTTPQTPQQTINLNDIQRRVDEGEITLGEAFQLQSQVMGQEYNKRLDSALKQYEKKTEREKYVEKFLSDNPGYEKAFNDGLLDEDMQRGLSAEHAWERYKGKQEKDGFNKKIQELQSQLDNLTKQANQDGLKTGVKIGESKQSAAKVLSGTGGGSFSSAPPNTAALSMDARRQSAIDRVNRMRAGGG